MRLTFQEFKQKLAKLKGGGEIKMSEQTKKKVRRRIKTAPQPACASKRYLQKHQHETPTRQRALRRKRNGHGVPKAQIAKSRSAALV